MVIGNDLKLVKNYYKKLQLTVPKQCFKNKMKIPEYF